MDKAPERIWAWVDELAGVVGSTHEPETPKNMPWGPNAVSYGAEYIRSDTHQAEIARLTAELREARMQALADGAQWQDDVARLTAEREAAVAAAYEAAADMVRDYVYSLSEKIRALATDTQRNALAEYGRRMKAEGLREAAKIQANAGLSSEREWAAQRSILARADEIERGDTA